MRLREVKKAAQQPQSQGAYSQGTWSGGTFCLGEVARGGGKASQSSLPECTQCVPAASRDAFPWVALGRPHVTLGEALLAAVVLGSHSATSCCVPRPDSSPERSSRESGSQVSSLLTSLTSLLRAGTLPRMPRMPRSLSIPLRTALPWSPMPAAMSAAAATGLSKL